MELGGEHAGEEDAGPEEEGGAEGVAAGVAVDGVEGELEAGDDGAEHGQRLEEEDVVLVVTAIHFHHGGEVEGRQAFQILGCGQHFLWVHNDAHISKTRTY